MQVAGSVKEETEEKENANNQLKHQYRHAKQALRDARSSGSEAAAFSRRAAAAAGGRASERGPHTASERGRGNVSHSFRAPPTRAAHTHIHTHARGCPLLRLLPPATAAADCLPDCSTVLVR